MMNWGRFFLASSLDDDDKNLEFLRGLCTAKKKRTSGTHDLVENAARAETELRVKTSSMSGMPSPASSLTALNMKRISNYERVGLFEVAF